MTFEEFWENACYKDAFGNCEPYYGIAKYAFEVGQENGVVWHDLRKAPDVLPEFEGDYLVALKPHGVTCVLSFRMVDGLNVWLEDFVELTEDVIAWCEIPEFKEEQ